MNWYMEALRNMRRSRASTAQGSAGSSCCSISAVVVLTLVDMAIGTFNQQAEIGLFGGVYLLAVRSPASR